VNNLVSNAIKFTPRGGNVAVSTAYEDKNGAPGVRIAVVDTGVGVNSSDQSKIFQRFRRGRDRGTEGETGTGLGLSICKEIVQLHGGTLAVNSEVSKGSAFVVWLPAQAGQGQGASGAEVQDGDPSQLTGRPIAC
jgi:signal transduction histidine kinase